MKKLKAQSPKSEAPQQEAEAAPKVEAIKIKMQKFVRQPDVELELDILLAEIVKDYERENEEMRKRIAENDRARGRMLGKILKMTGLHLRPNTLPFFKEPDSTTLCVPVPDVLAPQK